jgi:hypothetical protein
LRFLLIAASSSWNDSISASPPALSHTCKLSLSSIFGIFSLVRSAARVWNLNAHTILSVMQQHIISTLCLHQHQLQAAWQLMRETEACASVGAGACVEAVQTAERAAAASSDISQGHI